MGDGDSCEPQDGKRSPSVTEKTIDTYLCFIPRGLQRAAISYLHRQLRGMDDNHDCCATPTNPSSASVSSSSSSSSWIVRVSLLGENYYDRVFQMVHDPPSCSGPSPTSDHQNKRITTSKKRRRQNTSGQETCNRSQSNDGTVEQDGESIDEDTERYGIAPMTGAAFEGRKNRDYGWGYDRSGPGLWVVPGQAHLSVWLQLETNAPVQKVARLRGLGPILALAGYCDKMSAILSPAENDVHRVSEELSLAFTATSHDSQPRKLQQQKALSLWQRYVVETWNELRSEEQAILCPSHDLTQQELRFRISCCRSDSKSFAYTRQDLIEATAKWIVPYSGWKVDLQNYHIEVVLLLREQDFAIGYTLNPYLKAGSKSFATGLLPPDITPPYVFGKSDVVRLRPATAQLLLEMCRLQPGDVIIDPCVGLGTIPIEATLMMNRRLVGVSIGGDLILTPDSLACDASSYWQASQQYQRNAGADALVAWDACLLPLRDASADVILSDLPFGQKCSSSQHLNVLLPLILAEMTRVLVPNTGRMVLLCGHYVPVLNVIMEINRRATATSSTQCFEDTAVPWSLPCEAVFPVSIGGTMAWVIQVYRGAAKYAPLPKHRDKVRQVALRRAQNTILRNRLPNNSTNKRRVQA